MLCCWKSFLWILNLVLNQEWSFLNELKLFFLILLLEMQNDIVLWSLVRSSYFGFARCSWKTGINEVKWWGERMENETKSKLYKNLNIVLQRLLRSLLELMLLCKKTKLFIFEILSLIGIIFWLSVTGFS